MKRLLKFMLIGFPLGALVGILIVYLTSGGHFYPQELMERMGGSPAAAIAVQLVLSGLVGMVAFGGIMLYETDLPLAAAPVIHFCLIEVVFIPSSLFLNWVEPKLSQIAAMTLIMLVPFVVIWLIMYLRYKRIVKQLNQINERDKK